MALMFRIIESIPSKKAEPIKVWMAAVAAERINQAIDPERSIDQAIADYRRLGYSGAASLDALHKARFVNISPTTVQENHPHDVTIAKIAPNY